MRRRLLVLLVLCGHLAIPGLALEGKWPPYQLGELDPTWLQGEGLALDPAALWSDQIGGGLLQAVVDLGGCSAALVSRDGLLLTNHHCAFGALQHNSRPGQDLITDGFLAATRGAELSASGIKALIPSRFVDVTNEVANAVLSGSSDVERTRAIERVSKDLVARCEKSAGHRCRVAAFDGGMRFMLIDNLEYPDVRLVWAPPRSIGEFGGEIDNWSWPRHTGDLALLRVWAAPGGVPGKTARDNVPLHPAHVLPLAVEPIGDGSFVMVAGYPARSFRSFTAPEIGERAALYFPLRIELFGRWLDILNAAAAARENVRMVLADRIKGTANAEKNARGQVAGLKRGALVERRWAFENEVLRWAGEREAWRSAIDAHQELAGIVEARRATFQRDFLLDGMRRGPLPLDMALTLVRWARERAKPDIERRPAFMERNRDRLREKVDQDQKELDEPTERALMVDVLLRFAELPDGARSAAIDRFLGGARDVRTISGRVDTLFGATRVLDLAARRRMFDDNVAGLCLRRDQLLDLAFALDDELRELEARRESEDGAAARLRPEWLRAVHAFLGRPLAPDANGTLRVSFGHVQGYSPRDAVDFSPRTRVVGLVAKVTGEEPFAAPQALLAAAAAAPTSRWADAALGDVPIAFLADLDTTGGNSGSPVLNGRGELVGCNFDRVWENVANDFGYDATVNRNISVDARFLGWVLETLHGSAAQPLLTELGFARR